MRSTMVSGALALTLGALLVVAVGLADAIWMVAVAATGATPFVI